MAELKTRDGTWLDVPLRTVLRLRWHRRVNAAGIWLVEHGHNRAAARLWRIRP